MKKVFPILMVLLLFFSTGNEVSASSQLQRNNAAKASNCFVVSPNKKTTIFINSNNHENFLIGSLSNNKLTTKATSINGYDFSLSDGWVYYRNVNDSNSVYKIRKDGSGNKKISNISVTGLVLSNNVIYFTGKDNKLYKMSKNGGNVVRLSNTGVQYIVISNGWIYYTTYSNKAPTYGKLYKMKTNGTQCTKISNDNYICDITVQGTTLFYLGGDNNVYQTDLDRKYKKKLAYATYYCLGKGILYYTKCVKDGSVLVSKNIYSYNLKTSNTKMIHKGSFSMLSIFNGKLLALDDNGSLYCLSLNGKDKIKLGLDGIMEYTVLP
jgi:hypothetical protein